MAEVIDISPTSRPSSVSATNTTLVVSCARISRASANCSSGSLDSVVPSHNAPVSPGQTDLRVMLAGPKGREVGESGKLDKAVRKGEGERWVWSASLPLLAQEDP
eukprot:1194854-Prorocentrum_minimum.AAC.1